METGQGKQSVALYGGAVAIWLSASYSLFNSVFLVFLFIVKERPQNERQMMVLGKKCEMSPDCTPSKATGESKFSLRLLNTLQLQCI